MSYCFTVYDDSDRLMVSNSNEYNKEMLQKLYFEVPLCLG